MEQDNMSQSQMPAGNPTGVEDSVTSQTPAPNPSDPTREPTAMPPAVIARPRRPQRSARVESSVDISEPKAEPTPVDNQGHCAPDGSAASRAKPASSPPIRTSGDRPSIKAGPKGPGHQAVRAASVPHPPASKPLPSHLNPHAQRALSVAGTADTQAHTVEDFRVHIITWNVGSATPPDDITCLLGLHVGDGNTDMYIIGLQEVNSMINKRLKDVLFTDQWSEVCMERLSPFGYVLVTSQRMQGVLLLVFAKYYHLPFLRGVQTETTRTGLGGYWGNKGGVSARMSVFGHTICFLNCHLPAHMENSEQRMEDFESILQQQQFEGQAASGVLDHDVVFWFGDLNFRIDDLEMQVVKTAIDNNKLSTLWEKDQLNMAKDSETVLEGFQEGPLKFPPTYKFDVGTNVYDTSGKKRKPAWTDRILWRLRATAPAASPGKRSSTSGLTSGTKVTQHYYRSHMEYMVSDHKPVSSIFTLQFPYKVDVPLVTLLVEDEWNSIAEAIAKFKMAPNYSRSSWDWIGLYKVGFKHHKDYVGYVWAKQEEADFHRQEHQVTFTEEELPKGSGDFILGYYSNNMSTIVGVTEPFQIQLPTSGHDVSSSDSSDFSSEDDSTVVLMKSRSRSPSPHKGKHRRHRSGSHSRSGSPAQTKTVTDGSPSTTSTSECEPTERPADGSQRPDSEENNKQREETGV
ncbi:phosphatidylinositol 4,5-bisphosphate 5-phosphatase A [Dunckerocampus dactyliophorus]|uniref:phosphatidylinositol 4,5-bisphosphate 5-phosphatase A n=1 Tax=Dunckerocampus dactyliophorus TaxID=161453 RepID=UPI002406D6AF|nr:phosphatidylinositol 4,5-bisphosphate 5-phosphatase A [Dunckerocampus dactyliophorus]XP_054629978.1 phosphatidylinositol 4,5-bisphosphate 5-phosphatase A [Dunckerocampus dactyliophorus]XP_054629979.1 phosphatidylinositol 4,5-bisphosphate 5-phosphatase A [Dunckerocampus dactyliophorus]